MKYKVGDKVRIKSLDWYNENKDNLSFYTDSMALCFANEIVTIKSYGRYPDTYRIDEDEGDFLWTDEMIEGLVEEEETKPEPKFKVGDKIKLKSTLLNDVFDIIGYEPEGYRITNISNGLMYFMSYSIEHYYELVEEEISIDLTVKGEEVKERIEIAIPEGYEYVIESGKIIFHKKKPKHPQTYEACLKVLGFNTTIKVKESSVFDYDDDIVALQKLKRCRDAYWKIAGEEMGLGKSWEPDWERGSIDYVICNAGGKIILTDIPNSAYNHILTFPTEEMRDAFYEAFKEFIEKCKELL